MPEVLKSVESHKNGQHECSMKYALLQFCSMTFAGSKTCILYTVKPLIIAAINCGGSVY